MSTSENEMSSEDIGLLTKRFSEMLLKVKSRRQANRSGRNVSCFCANSMSEASIKIAQEKSEVVSDDSAEKGKLVSNYVDVTTILEVPSVCKNSADVSPSVTSQIVTSCTESDSDEDSIEEETYESLLATHRKTLGKMVRVCEHNLRLTEMNDALEEGLENAIVDCEVLQEKLDNAECCLREMLQRAEKAEGILHKMNSGKAKLDDLLSMGKAQGDRHGLGYVVDSLLECSTSKCAQFVQESAALNRGSDVDKKKQPGRNGRRSIVCNFCKKNGHPEKRCFKKLQHLKVGKKANIVGQCIEGLRRQEPTGRKVRRMWVKKELTVNSSNRTPHVLSSISPSVITSAMTERKTCLFNSRCHSSQNCWRKNGNVNQGNGRSKRLLHNRRRFRRKWMQKEESFPTKKAKIPHVMSCVVTSAMAQDSASCLNDRRHSSPNSWIKKMLMDYGVHPNGRVFLS